MVEKQLADKNKLQINGTLEIQSEFEASLKVKFKIIGIYSAPPADKSDEGVPEFDPSDTVYTTYNSVAQILSVPGLPSYDATTADKAYYYIDDPSNIASFEAAAKKIPGMDKYLLTTDNDLYSRITGPIKATQTITLIMVGILLCAGCLILALIIALSLGGRRREFGRLLAVGEKKSRVILQVFVETLITVSIAFCVEIFSSGFISQQVCNKILANGASIVEQQDKQNMQDVSYLLNKASQLAIAGEFNSSTATPIEKVNVTVTPATVGDFAGCGLLIILISLLFSLVKIMRLSPMSILTKKE